MGRFMRKLPAIAVAFFILGTLMLSVIPSHFESPERFSRGIPAFVKNALVFPGGLNTSSTVSEYPLVSRGLMLPGGSASATLADINGDGLTDLTVAVYQTKNVSLFYRQKDGNFPSYPSYNITLPGFPLSVSATDLLGTGDSQIAVLEKRTNVTESDHLEVFEHVSDTNYQRIRDRPPPHENSSALVVGDFNADGKLDMAVSSSGPNPSLVQGRVDITFGPLFSNWDVTFRGGLGTNALVTGDFDSDGHTDMAVANFLEDDVLVFNYPFSDLMLPTVNLTAHGAPMSLASGNFTSNDFTDLAVLTPSAIHFFCQDASGLPTHENYNRSIPFHASFVVAGDMNNDSYDDLLILSLTDSRACGFYQHQGITTWLSTPDFMFPTGSGPRASLIGELDGGASLDVAIFSARNDWTGSSAGIYPGYTISGNPYYKFTNSNQTIWADSNAGASMFASGDLNGDGTQDLVLLYPSVSYVRYMLSFDSSHLYTLGLGATPSKMLVADFNDDLYVDILVVVSGSPDITIYYGGETVPTGSETIHCGGVVTDVAIGDLDNDSLMDLVVTTANGLIDIFYNSWDGPDPYFPNPDAELAPTPGIAVQTVIAGDFNSDGLVDIAYPNSSAGQCAIDIAFQSEIYRSFSLPANITLFASPPDHFNKLWSSDLNGDGRLDLAAMRPATHSVYLFNQTDFETTRTLYKNLSLPEMPSFISVEDATDDGYGDIVATYPSADLLFLYKQVAGQLPDAPSMVFVTGALPNYVGMADAMGHGRTDLIVSNGASHSLSVWERFNFPPVALAGGPYQGTEGAPVLLAGSETREISEIPNTLYKWTFGDGEVGSWSGSPTASHIYASQGDYTAIFEVKDPENLTNSSIAQVHIVDSVPIASFSISPASPPYNEGQQVIFTNTSYSWDPLVLLNWTVDGQLVSSDMMSVLSRVFDNGTHSVTLKVVDSDGSSNETTVAIVVGAIAPVVTIHSVAQAREGSLVQFVAYVDQWHSGIGDHIVSYEWNFSYTGPPFSPDAFTGTVNHTTHSFSTASQSTVYTVAVRVTDNDGNQTISTFDISIWDVTVVTLAVSSTQPIDEWSTVSFTATLDSALSAISYSWDFDAATGFLSDSTTTVGQNSHVYQKAGVYKVQIVVTVSNSSTATNLTYVTIADVVPSSAASDLVIKRNPSDTSNLSFCATNVSSRFHDLVRTYWDFGDGSYLDLYGGPASNVSHMYNASRNYLFQLNMTDDDGNLLTMARVLRMDAPTIELRPALDAVVKSGTVIRFSISDDTPPLVRVQYSVDGPVFINFTLQWEIQTTGWTQGDHAVVVKAQDQDGNIAISSTVAITIDDMPPEVTAISTAASVFGGSKLNLTVSVADPHIGSGGVVLYVKFPGDTDFQSLPMSHGSGDVYYRVVDIPLRKGVMQYYVAASDMAHNSADSQTLTLQVKLHFIDAAWPYMLLTAALVALGTVGYFMREEKIAVDETFVIYNDGRLISHTTRRLKPGMDDQILSGMLVAIQDFVKDSFKDVTSFTLRKLEFGEKSVLIEKGKHLFLAVILHGTASKKVAARMQAVVSDIEQRFKEHLVAWDGDLDKVRGVNDSVKKLYSRAPLLPGPFRKQGS